jgi:hypothetical protein
MQTTVETRLREAEDRARLAQNVLSAALVLDEAGIAPRSTLAHRLFHECVRLDDEHAMRRHIQASTRLAGVPLPAAAAAPSGQRRKPYAQGALDLFASLTVAPDTFGRSIRGLGHMLPARQPHLQVVWAVPPTSWREATTLGRP